MPFADISLARGKSPDYRHAVSRAVYDALVSELGMKPDDDFQLIHEVEPGAMVFPREFRGGPRSTDWIVVRITDTVAIEALDAAAENPGSRETYTKGEMAYAITELFAHRDSSHILPMLRDDFVMSLPESLPYGGDYVGRKTFEDFFAKTPGGTEVWESFSSRVDQVIEAEGYFAVQLTNTAVPKATGVPVVLHNLWLFEVAGGRLVGTRLYADTARVGG